MLEYVQLYPETLAAVKRYPAADRALLYEAMVAYGTAGEEPDWPEDDLKWLIWESLRQRIDLAARKSETNRNNRRKAETTGTNPNETERTGTKQNEPERIETNPNETERIETIRNPQSESESDAESESEADPESPVEREHTHREQPEGSAGARAGAGQGSLGGDRVNGETVPAGWYDPKHPDRPCDASWLGSDAARKSIAQRILDYVTRHKVITLQAINAESGRVIGREIMPALQAAMAAGKSPGECQRLARDARALWVWEIRLKEAALEYGTAPPGMAAAWREDVAEMAGEAEEVALYG